MKTVGLLAAIVLALSAQATATQPQHVHLVYRFGYNTEATDSGQGTGTTTIDVKGVAPDGGMIVDAADFWWNAVRSRAANECEVYKDGSVDCKKAPYAISPMQLTILPLLAKGFFSHLGDGHGKWTQNFTVKAAVVPGATGFAGQKYTWTCAFTVQGKGPIANSTPPLMLVQSNGTLSQGYFKATSKARIGFDPAKHVPAIVSERRTHIPQRSSESFDVINLKLQKIQQS